MQTEELFTAGLAELGMECSVEQRDMFLLYLSELKKWNRAYNLTAIRTDRDIVIKHFLDSLLYLQMIPEDFVLAADIGSGAGFPGIPMKIMRPGMTLTLVEPSRKKAAFLRHMIRILGLAGIAVKDTRMESLGEESLGYYDVLVSRAAFSIEEFAASACRYVNKRGFLLMSKGPAVHGELEKIRIAGSSGSIDIREIRTLCLPFINAERNLIRLLCKMGT